MPETLENEDPFKCPLCVGDPYITHDPHRFWFHLASEHKTSELKLSQYAYNFARKHEWNIKKNLQERKKQQEMNDKEKIDAIIDVLRTPNLGDAGAIVQIGNIIGFDFGTQEVRSWRKTANDN